MNKSTWIKRAVATFLVVLMSIESFAAVVGDNDGAAFITKAEFESLKNDFQTQINRYNFSLDSKIDGAIANYLAGVTVAKTSQLVDLLSPAIKKSITNTGFVYWETPNNTRDVPDVTAGLYWNRLWGTSSTVTDGRWKAGWIISNGAAWAGLVDEYRYHNWNETINDYDSYYYLVNFPFGEANNATRRTTKNVVDWTLNSINRNRCSFRLRSMYNQFSWAALDLEIADIVNIEGTRIDTDFTAGAEPYTYGPGFGNSSSSHWAWNMNVTPILYISHAWSIWQDQTSSSTDTKRKAIKLNYMLAGDVSGTTKCVDFAFRDSYTDANPYSYQIAAYTPSTNNNGGESGSQLELKQYDAANDAWNYAYQLDRSLRAYNNNIIFNWIWNRQTIYDLHWDKLTQAYWNGIFSTPYYKFEGIPICRTPNTTGKIKFKLKFTNKSIETDELKAPTPTSRYYTFVITDKKFKNGAMPTVGSTDTYWRDIDGYDHVLYREVRNSGSAEYTTDWLEFDKTKIIDKDNGDYIYVKVSPYAADQVVTVEVADLITYTEEG